MALQDDDRLPVAFLRQAVHQWCQAGETGRSEGRIHHHRLDPLRCLGIYRIQPQALP